MKKQRYTMEDFRMGGLSVAIRNDRERDEFLWLCEKNGIIWQAGQKATEHKPRTPYPYAIVCGLHAANRIMYKKEHADDISLSRITGNSTTPHYQIVIDCDDNKTTVARLLVDGREVKRREARRHPSDGFSLRKGAEMAFGRLWDKPVKAEKKPIVREVKRFAKAGEWIKIVAPSVSCGMYHEGDVLYACRSNIDGVVKVHGITIRILPSEYVVLEGYAPKERKA